MVITFDIDWAPDFMIDAAAEMLLARRVKATWFVTHECDAVGRLAEHPDLFELGIHPNFHPESTQGDTPEAILRYCMDLVPQARSSRSHDLFQSTRHMSLLTQHTPILTDVSLFLPRAKHLQPVPFHWQNRTLTRLPYSWEDDYEMMQPDAIWRPDEILSDDGLVIFDFHPVHVFLNSPHSDIYLEYRHRLASGQTPSFAAMSDLIHPGRGTRTMLEALIEQAAACGGGERICDLVGI